MALGWALKSSLSLERFPGDRTAQVALPEGEQFIKCMLEKMELKCQVFTLLPTHQETVARQVCGSTRNKEPHKVRRSWRDEKRAEMDKLTSRFLSSVEILWCFSFSVSRCTTLKTTWITHAAGKKPTKQSHPLSLNRLGSSVPNIQKPLILQYRKKLLSSNAMLRISNFKPVYISDGLSTSEVSANVIRICKLQNVTCSWHHVFQIRLTLLHIETVIQISWLKAT